MRQSKLKRTLPKLLVVVLFLDDSTEKPEHTEGEGEVEGEGKVKVELKVKLKVKGKGEVQAP